MIADRSSRSSDLRVILVTMRSTSLAEAKARLSDLVDQAERRGTRTLILRDGKPVAAIVPVDVATRKPTAARPVMSEDEARRSVEAFIAAFSACEPDVSAVEALRAGRR